MNAAAIQGLHGSLGSTRVIVFHEAIVESFTLELFITGVSQRFKKSEVAANARHNAE
jgi:hypothetical protein